MPTARQLALQDIAARVTDESTAPVPLRTSEYFGINTFGARQMRDKLPKERLRQARSTSFATGRSSTVDIAPTRRAGDQGMGDLAAA